MTGLAFCYDPSTAEIVEVPTIDWQTKFYAPHLPDNSTLKHYTCASIIVKGEPEHYFMCKECKTVFPMIDGEIKCNGYITDQCPWCRPDSKPWTYGRGL